MRKPVLTIFYQFNPWQTSIGGIQTFIRTFIKYAPQDFDVRLVGTGEEDKSIGQWQERELDGKTLQFMPLFVVKNDDVRQRIPTSVRYTLALLFQCLASDFMHFHRLEPSLATRHWTGQKTLFIHNDIRQQISSRGKGKAILWQRFPQLFYALERSLIGQFNQIYSCNTESLQYYQQRYPVIADRMSYLKNTVDTEIFYPLSSEQRELGRRELAQKLGLSEQTQFILFAGRLHPQKDPILLVRAMAALNLPEAHLLIAGNGELLNDIQQEIQQLQLATRITLLGAVPQAQLAQLQQVSRLLVLTSHYEGLPICVLEALSCGIPIVTTRCGETPNLLIPGSGVVCSDRSETAIAEAFEQVILQPHKYPTQACVQAAQPYAAHTVVHSIFDAMLDCWQPPSHSVLLPSPEHS